MEKFLQLVEENLPEKDIEKITIAKNNLTNYLNSLAPEGRAIAVPRVFRDEISIKLKDGTVVTVEVKDVKSPKVEASEDAEDMGGLTTAVRAVASLPDQGLMKQIGSPTARKLAGAKRKLADAVDTLADKLAQAAKSSY